MSEIYGITVNIDVFDDAVNVFFGDIEKCLEHFEQQGCTGYDTDSIKSGIVDGFVMYNEDGDSFVYVGKNLSNKNTICHELMHAILTIVNKRGIKLHDESGEQEVACYLVGHVMGKVLNTPKKKWFVRKKDKWVSQ